MSEEKKQKLKEYQEHYREAKNYCKANKITRYTTLQTNNPCIKLGFIIIIIIKTLF